MKALIASLAALGLIATPALAQTKAAAPAAKTTKSVAKEAKAEGESTATEANEHKAARHHHAMKCSCPKVAHHKAHKTMHKTAVKKTTTEKKTS
jgi:hypothetical protein